MFFFKQKNKAYNNSYNDKNGRDKIIVVLAVNNNDRGINGIIETVVRSDNNNDDYDNGINDNDK